MICTQCGGHVLWMGPASALTHTQCQVCGSINCHEGEVDLSGTEADEEIGAYETKDHLALIAKLSSVLQQFCELGFADEEDMMHIKGHGTYTIGDLLDEADEMLGIDNAKQPGANNEH